MCQHTFGGHVTRNVSFDSRVIQSGTCAFKASCKGMYGLMSSTGVPSIRSSPERYNFLPRMLLTRARVMPTGFGRWGEREANMPIFLSNLGGRILAKNVTPKLPIRCCWCRKRVLLAFEFAWNKNTIHTYSKPSSPSNVQGEIPLFSSIQPRLAGTRWP